MENLKPIGAPKKPVEKKWHKQQEKSLKIGVNRRHVTGTCISKRISNTNR